MTPAIVVAKNAIVASAINAGLVILSIGMGINPTFNIILLAGCLGIFFSARRMMKRGE